LSDCAAGLARNLFLRLDPGGHLGVGREVAQQAPSSAGDDGRNARHAHRETRSDGIREPAAYPSVVQYTHPIRVLRPRIRLSLALSLCCTNHIDVNALPPVTRDDPPVLYSWTLVEGNTR
jgi:hypothetical protein